MADILTAVKSVREHENNEPFLQAVDSKDKKTVNQRHVPASTKTNPDDVLQVLRGQPDLETVIASLKKLLSSTFKLTFNIYAPGPAQAQIISTLLNTILPDFWSVFQREDARLLAACLQSLAGLNAIVARLRLVSSQPRKAQDGSAGATSLSDLLELAELVLEGDSTVCMIYETLRQAVTDELKFDLSWKEVFGLLGSGKVPAALAQAEDSLKDDRKTGRSPSELANGAQYASWLGSNIEKLCFTLTTTTDGSDDAISAASQLLSKALNLGYPTQLLAGLFHPFVDRIIQQPEQQKVMTVLLVHLPSHSKRPFIEHTLRWLSKISSSDDNDTLPDLKLQGTAASALTSFVTLITSADPKFQVHLRSFLTDPALSGTLSFQVRRVCLSTISHQESESGDLQTLIEKVMSLFNDQLFISHAPATQQEALAQTLLLAAGYLHRQMPMALLLSARSSNHMQGVSNRLDSSNLRARWLGMVVGTAISSLVDKEGVKISFGTEDMETEEAGWYRSLVKIDDEVGEFGDLRAIFTTVQQSKPRSVHPTMRKTQVKKMAMINGKPTFGPPRPPAQTEIIGERITEVVDGGDDDDNNNNEGDDLKPYAKPDSDPEDSDEDATLVNRNKPKRPVYIRDLMAMLRDDQNHGRFTLGITHAAALIRRKSAFGNEVRDHANEVAVILCNLSDPFEIEDFENLRLQAMVAVLLSDVPSMAPWFCKQAFVGDYSIAQRCMILSTIGLSGRELAGLQNEDEHNPAVTSSDFPSKRLPPHLHAIYAATTTTSPQNRLDAATRTLEHTLIQPLALRAADDSTAHLHAVKIRTFSSRMDVARTTRKPAPNALATVFGKSFFFPLVNRYQQEIAAYGSASTYASVSVVTVTFVKTLALLLHAAGPATVGLGEMSGEFWELLLSLRVRAAQDGGLLHAVLFGVLMVLESNDGDKRRLVDEHAKELMETRRWVEVVFERMGEGVGEGAKVRALAAGVLVKTREIIEAYQKDFVGYGV